MSIYRLLCSTILVLCATLSYSNSRYPVSKHVLSNGLTVLVRPVKTSQKVAFRLFYDVGAKHEESHEKGIAHLIEHMLFKGTTKLSETDIFLVTQKFSGYWNAFTTRDYTAMVLNFPTESWKVALPILAECMTECTFKQELLHSELKAVVQELKMYKDHHVRSLIWDLMTAIYPEHPYHYPVIGYKHDLYHINSDKLKAFYKKHYVPNNAVLVVVGNIDPLEVMQQAQAVFGHIPRDPNFKKAEFFLSPDLREHSVKLYRDVRQPKLALAFAIPGIRQSLDTWALLNTILTDGKASRLYSRLVDELQLATDISGFRLSLSDSDLYTFLIAPRDSNFAHEIASVVNEELQSIAQNGCSQDEIKQAHMLTQAALYDILESNDQQADSIGELFLATGDEQSLYKGIKESADFVSLNQSIMEFAATHLCTVPMHKGFILPLTKDGIQRWKQLQARSDEEDAQILSGKIRTSEIEEGRYVNTLNQPDDLELPSYPIPQETTLSNGLRVLYYKTDHVPLIKLKLILKADNIDYEPGDKPGLFECLASMLREGGTHKRSAQALYQAFNRLGASITVGAFSVTATFGSNVLPEVLSLLHELIVQAALDESALPQVKTLMRTDYKSLWDDARSITQLITAQTVFKGHPHGINHVPDPEIIDRYTHQDVLDAYNTFISPCNGMLILVGDLERYPQVDKLLDDTFGSWQGNCLSDKAYPVIQRDLPTTLYHSINRDQTILSLAGLSVGRFHPDFDALLLYEILLYKRLFSLREKTGAFYTIFGSLTEGPSEEPRVAHITTIVSNDRLDEVYHLLRDFIEHDIDLLTEQDLEIARQNLVQRDSQRYATNAAIANTFEKLAYYKLPFDYFESRMQIFAALSLEQVKQAVKRIYNVDSMHTILVGRVGTANQCSQVTAPAFDTEDQCVSIFQKR